MKESMIQEALMIYEQRGDTAVEEINAIMKNWEYTNTVAEYRKVDKLSSLVERYGDSAEAIIIRKEERMMLLHFVCWFKRYLYQVRPLFWYVWRDSIVFGLNREQCAAKYGISKKYVTKIRTKCKEYLKKAKPLYYEQFGDLEEYLKS